MPARLYKIIIKICPFCFSNFETSNGGQQARQFCSKSCAMKSRKLSDENKKNISDALVRWNENNTLNPDFISKHNMSQKFCLDCGKIFSVYNKVLKFCSRECSDKHHKDNYQHSLETKIKIGEANKISMEKSSIMGWRPRTEPSFPESIVISILDKNNIVYVREYPVKRWFVDFTDPQRKIAVEIDGKQHQLPERKISDSNKDFYLRENGWSIFRIAWQKLTPQFYIFLEEKLISIFRKEEQFK
jgi:very-short-patch-repair endonuclease